MLKEFCIVVWVDVMMIHLVYSPRFEDFKLSMFNLDKMSQIQMDSAIIC